MMNPTTPAHLADTKVALKEINRVLAQAAGNLVRKIHRGDLKLDNGAPLSSEERARIKATRFIILGGSYATEGFSAQTLPLLMQEQIQAADSIQGGPATDVKILAHRADAATAGCIGAFSLAITGDTRVEVERLCGVACAQEKIPLIVLLDIGGTKTEMRLAQLTAEGKLTFNWIRSHRTNTPKERTPAAFYNIVADSLANNLITPEVLGAYEILPFLAVGQPGRFEDPKSVIAADTARDLGPSFPGCCPSALLQQALRSVTAIPFDVFVCNDGRAQCLGIVETIRREDPDQWEKMHGQKLAYLGIGTGLGFGYGSVDEGGGFNLHDLHGQLQVTASEEWERLETGLTGVEISFPYEYRDVVCGKSITRMMHQVERARAQRLFVSFTHLAHAAPVAAERLLATLTPDNSPLNGELLNRILEADTLDAVTDLRLRLAKPILSALLNRTLINFSSALRSAMVDNIDRAQTEKVIEAIETAARNGNRIQFVGIGKSHLIGECLAQIFTNLEIPALSFELTGADRENITNLMEGDVVFLISKSGETVNLLSLFPNLAQKRCVTVAITGNADSPLAKLCAYCISSTIKEEAHQNAEAPTTSATAALAAGAALGVVASLHLPHSKKLVVLNRPGMDPDSVPELQRPVNFDPVAKIKTAYQIFADSISSLPGDKRFVPSLLALARKILVSHKAGRTVFFTGAGGSYTVAKKVAATLTSLGIKAQAINAAQLPHGDLGHVSADGLLVVLSFRGKTKILIEIAKRAKNKSVELALITGIQNSPLTELIKLHVVAPSPFDDERFAGLPDQTIFATVLNLAVGDALAILLSEMEPISDQQFATSSHPGGAFARREGRINKEVLAGVSRSNIHQVFARSPDAFKSAWIKVDEKHLGYFLDRGHDDEIMIIGAGGIGLALLGPKLHLAGKALLFIDSDLKVVQNLEAKGMYQIRRVGSAGHHPPAAISRLAAMHLDANTEDDIASLAVRVDVAFTAVGTQHVEELASLVIKMAKYRYAFYISAPLNLVLCENFPVGDDPVSPLRKKIKHLLELESPDFAAYFDQTVGLAAAMDEAIVPAPDPTFSAPIAVEAEPAPVFVDTRAWKRLAATEYPSWPGIRFEVPFEGLHRRKLWVHNLAHAVIAFLGHFAGYIEMSEAVQDQEIFELAKQSAQTVAQSLYNDWIYQDHYEPEQYVNWLLERYYNPELADPISRVCRDPERKLGQFDRFIGAVNHVITTSPHSDIGKIVQNLRGALMGIVAAMHYASNGNTTKYIHLKELVLGRVSLDSRYFEDAERDFENFIRVHAAHFQA